MASSGWLAFMTSARMMSLCFLVAQNTSLVLVMRHVRSRKDHEMFLASTAVVCDEMLKFSVCCAMVALELSAVAEEKSLSLLSKFRRTVVNQEGSSMAVPALLYALQKNLLYVALSNLDASVYQVAYQGKILTTALFSYLMLQTPLTRRKIGALLCLATGVALVELAKMDRGSAAEQERHDGQSPGRGFVAVAMACCTSGFASVFFEYKLKQRKPDDQKQASVWVRNLQLSFFTGTLALSTVALKDGQEVLEGGFFQGYDGLVCLTILLEGWRALAREIKQRLEALCGCPAASQRLLCEHSLLEDENDFDLAAEGGCSWEKLLQQTPLELALTLVLCHFDQGLALIRAAQYGHEAAAASLLSRSAGNEGRAEMLAATNGVRETALHTAARKGHASICLSLLGASQDRKSLLMARTLMGQTPLQKAVCKGHKAVCKALVDSAQTEERSEMLAAEERATGSTALHLAVSGGHAAVWQVLLESAETLEQRGKMLGPQGAGEGRTPLHLAAQGGDAAAVCELLHFARSTSCCWKFLSAKDGAGASATHLAATAGHVAVVRALLGAAETSEERRELLRATDGRGFTPLHAAAAAGSFRTLVELASCTEATWTWKWLAAVARPLEGGLLGL